MLRELFIENSAVIKKADIRFSDGFNVFTGETGAGKSVLIGSLSAVCGSRISRDMIRTGERKATVSAVFDGGAEDIVLYREISSDGKSSSRINGRPCSAAELSETAGELLNIHGQRDTAALFSPQFQLSLVDIYGELEGIIADYKDTFSKLREKAKELKETARIYRENTEKLSAAAEAVSEIEAVKPKLPQDEDIDNELRFLQNAESFKAALGAAKGALKFADDGSGALNQIRFANDNIKPFSDSSADVKELSARLDSLYIELADIVGELGKTADNTALSEERLHKLTERKNALNALKKRYGGSIEAVLCTLEASKKLIKSMETGEAELAKLTEEKQILLESATKKAAALSEKRIAAAELLSAEIKDKLSFLDMPNVRTRFEFTKGKLTETGLDSAEILISPNPGEDMKPLSKIASGGELSRIMLAVKTVTAKYADVGTMIFDEIDAGVSGRAAEKIGSLLRELSKTRQVIVVTHLAQIAVCADRHMLIEKTSSDRTFTVVKVLNEKERALEIARIQVGGNITETAVKNAEEQIALRK
jgi:DNA repair protein RecN (Recombination protein N)